MAKAIKKATRATKAAPATVKPCKKTFTQTEVLDMMAEAMGDDVTRAQAKSGVAFLRKLLVASLKKGGIGKVKLLDINFKSVHKPAQKMPAIRKGATVKGFGGAEVISPGRAAFTKPPVTRIKGLALSAFKRDLQA